MNKLYCKNCGTKNAEGSLYCAVDGSPLEGPKENLQIVKGTPKFCKACSHPVDAYANYCVECGHSTGVVQEKKVLPISIPTSKKSHTYSQSNTNTSLSSVVSLPNLISASKFAGVAFVIAIIFSMIGSKVMNSMLAEVMKSELYLPEALMKSIKLVSWSDVLMVTHLSGLKYTAQALFLEGGLTVKGGLVIMAIVPFITLFIVGMLANRNQPNKLAIHRLQTAAFISAIYALVMAIFSLFAGVSVTIPDPSGFMDSITVKADYQFFQVLKNTFVLAILFTSLGSFVGLRANEKSAGSNVNYGVSISQSIKASLVGILVSIILVAGIIGTNEETKDVSGGLNVVLSSQIGAYVWNMAHFNSIKGTFSDYYEEVEISASFLGGAKFIEGGYVEEESLSEEFGIGIYLFLLLPFAIYFLAGRKLRKAQSSNILFEVGVFALSVGVVNVLLFSVLNFSVATSFAIFDGMENISLGFSLVTTFIFFSIYAFIGAYVGVLSSKNNAQNQSEYQENVA